MPKPPTVATQQFHFRDARIASIAIVPVPGKHITATSHLIVKAVDDMQNLVSGGFR